MGKSTLLTNRALPAISHNEVRAAFTNTAVGVKLNRPLDVDLTISPLLFPPRTRLRLIAIRITDSNYFTNFMLLVIALNCFTMSQEHPESNTKPNAVDKVIKVIDPVVLAIFTLEMILKIVAQGLVLQRNTYLRDGWNFLDFLIVLCAFLQLVAGDGIWGYIRILRPLRLINKIDGFKVIMRTLVRTLPMMRDIFLLLGFLMCAFSIFGMHLWADEMYQRCFAVVPVYFNGTEQLYPTDGYIPAHWSKNASLWPDNITVNGTFRVLVQNDSRPCAPSGWGRSCRADAIHWPQECGVNTEPKRPVFNFDHFGNAILFVLKIFSLDNWPDLMKDVMASTGTWACIYFVAATLFGGYLCLNLVIAVLSSQFVIEETEKLAVEDKEGERKEKDGLMVEKVASPMTCLSAKLLRPIFACALDVRGGQSHCRMERILRMMSPQTQWKSLLKGLGGRVESREESARRIEGISHTMPPRSSHLAARRATVRGARPPALLLEKANSMEEQGTQEAFDDVRSRDAEILSPKAPRYSQKDSNSVTPTSWIQHGYKPLERIVCSFWANIFVLAATFTNAVILSMDHYGIEKKPALKSFVNYTSLGFTVFFLLDWVLKVAALGPRNYVNDGFNLLDGVLCIASLPDIAGNTDDGGSAFSALRACRLFRVLRLARSWKSLQALLDTVFLSIKSVSYLSGLFLIVIFCFAVFAFQAFGADVPGMRMSFDSVFESLLTVVIIISGENWSDMMEAMMQTHGYTTCLYFVALTVVGNFVMLNLFVAIILDNFGGESDADETKQEELCLSALGLEKQNISPAEVSDQPTNVPRQTSSSADVLGEVPLREQEALESDVKVEPARSLRGPTFSIPDFRTKPQNRDKAFVRFKRAEFGNEKSIRDREWVKQDGIIEYERLQWIGTESDAFCAACGCSPLNGVRQHVICVVKSKYFDGFILFCIIMSSIFLSLDNPSLEGSKTLDTILTFDTIFVVIFFIEMVLKIIALGLFQHEGAYLRDGWNILDAFVVITSILSLQIDAFKIFRALRVMRLLSRSVSMRLVLTSLLGSVPWIANVLVLGFLLFWIFAIVGVSLFKGSFYECSDPSVTELGRCVGSFNQTANDLFGNPYMYVDSRVWRSRGSGFDHLGEAMFTLFSIAVKDGWFNAMYNAMDAQGENLGPSRGANPYSALYFIVFLVIGGFFLINLFVGVLVDRFSEMKARGEGSAFMTEDQRNWVLAQKVVFRTALVPVIEPPEHRFRKFFYWICFHPLFEAFFTLVIVVNSVILAARTQHQSDATEDAFFIINTVLLSLFTVEIIIKVIALLPRRYILDRWNIFDVVVVTLSWIGYSVGGSGASIVRLFRVGRLFMLVKKAKGLQTLINTLLQALPAFLNISFLLLVVYFIFGIMGVQLFGRTPHGNAVDEMTNFETVWNALITLFTIGTTETWEDVMNSVGETSSMPIAIAYFYVFMMIGAFIMMNVLITIITEAFEEASDASSNSDKLALFDHLVTKWLDYDPLVSQRMKAESFLKMVAELPKPLWIDEASVNRLTRTPVFVVNLRQLRNLHVPINRDSYVRYQDVVAAFALVIFNVDVNDAIRASKKCPDGVTWDQEDFSIHHYVAAARIGEIYKAHLATRETNKLSPQRKASKQAPICIQNHASLRSSELSRMLQTDDDDFSDAGGDGNLVKVESYGLSAPQESPQAAPQECDPDSRNERV